MDPFGQSSSGTPPGDAAYGAARWSVPMRELATRARAASRAAARLTPATRQAALEAMAAGVRDSATAILDANGQDFEAARAAGLTASLLDRLRLDAHRLAAMAEAIEAIACQANCVGEVLEERLRPDGLHIRRVRVPLGVVAMIYESRPNVTADAAALCLKSGNAAILRGGSEALRSNQAILAAMQERIRAHLPDDAIQPVPTTDRAAVAALLACDDLIDLVIPRGGESLVNAVCAATRIPVLKHAKGVCHVYVDRAADLEMAERIIENAKCQRPGVCNAAETLLVHRDVATAFLPSVARWLRGRGVELRCDARALALCDGGVPATEADWPAEYLDLVLAVAVVDDLEAAMAHIERHGSRHSDAIVTEDREAAKRFLDDVDSAAVYWNASTRFTDGGELGLGAEIGISTGKLHARGPCGARELTTSKWVVTGHGHVRG